MKTQFKGILLIMLLLAAGLFGLESYCSGGSEKAMPAHLSQNRSEQKSPLYNTSDASVKYGFPLSK